MRPTIRHKFMGAALAFSLSASAFAADEGAMLPLDDVWARYDTLTHAGNYKDALATMTGFADDTRRPAADRARIYGMSASLCTKLGDKGCYSDRIGKAIAADTNVGHFMAALLFSDAPDKNRAIESFIWLVQNRSGMLQGISLRQIWDYVNHYRDTHQEDKAYALLTILHDSGYVGDSEGDSPEYLWLELARLMVAKGEQAQAETLVRKTPFGVDFYVRAWQDMDYVALWPMLEKDPRYAPDKLLDMDLKMAALHQASAQKGSWNQWLHARLEKVQALRGANRPADAILAAQQTLDAVPEKDRTADYYFWVQNELAYAYEDAGQVDEAISLLAMVTKGDIDKTPSLVNQVINYGEMLWRHGRYEEAIKIADKALAGEGKTLSAFGAYWSKASKVCALHALGRDTEAAALYDPMFKSAETNYGAATMAALCLGREDDAATLYKARLKSEEYRSSALLALSRFKEDGPEDGATALRALVRKIAKRPDVLAVVKPVGRLGDWSFSLSYWGQF